MKNRDPHDSKLVGSFSRILEESLGGEKGKEEGEKTWARKYKSWKKGHKKRRVVPIPSSFLNDVALPD